MNDRERANARQRFQEWQRFADDDEALVIIALREKGPANPICFHAQQIAEKYLKGFLAYHKQPPIKSHNLTQLLRLCVQIDSQLQDLEETIIQLSAFYVETRYPGDAPEFTLEEAQRAYEDALRVKQRITAMLEPI
jgi:HEPN domain-containing protein